MLDPVTFPVSVPYEAKVLVRRRRLAEEAVLKAETAVQVRRIAKEDAPHVARVKVGSVVVPFRSFDRGLWAPFRTTSAGEAFAADEFVRAVAKPDARDFSEAGNPFHFLMHSLDAPGVGRLKTLSVYENGRRRPHRPIGTDLLELAEVTDPALAIDRLQSSEIDRRLADAQRVADSLAFVDGEVWYRCHEPYWTLPLHKYDDDPRLRCVLRLKFGTDGETDENRLGSIPCTDFRLDRHEEALRFAAVLGAEVERTDLDRIEMLSPGAFGRNDTRLYARWLSSRLHCAYRFLHSAPPDLLRQWGELRDMSAKNDKDWSRDRFMETLDGLPPLRAYLDAVAPPEPDPEQPDEEDPRTRERRTVLRLLRRDLDLFVRRAVHSEGWTPDTTLEETDDVALSQLGPQP